MLRSGAIAGLGIVGAALVGCGDDDDDAPAATATVAATGTPGADATATPEGSQPRRGGVWRTADTTVGPHFSVFHPGADPSPINTWRSETGYYDKLWHLREVGLPESLLLPRLAESIEQVDETTVVVRIRPARFHDQPASNSNDRVGARALSAEDVVARYEYQKQPGVSGNPFIAKQLQTTAIDERTVRFEMPRPFAFFYEGGRHTGEGAMTRAYEVPQEMLDEETLKNHIPIGTGPFMYKSHQQGSREEMVRNPDYWREDLPYLDGKSFTVIPDSAAAEAAFRAGQIEAMSFTDILQRDSVIADLGDRIETRDYPGTGSVNFILNVRRPPWTDERVRRAVHRCIDVDRIIDVVFFGDAKRAWYFAEALNTRFPVGFDAVKEYVGYDPEEARALLDAARSAGTYDGREIDLMLPAETQSWVDSGRLVAEDMEKVGFPVRAFTEVRNIYLQVSGPKDLEDMSKPSPFDMTMSISLGYNFQKTDSGTFWNNNSLEDPEVDELIDQIALTVDPVARAELSNEFEIMLARKAANFIPVLTTNSHLGWYSYVRGQDYEMSRSGFGGWQPGLWFDA